MIYRKIVITVIFLLLIINLFGCSDLNTNVSDAGLDTDTDAESEERSGETDTADQEPHLAYGEEKYKITVTDDVVNKINSYGESYPVFEVEIIDHFEWAEKFVKAIKGDQLNYEKGSYPALEGSSIQTLDQSIHYWKKGDEFITYFVENDNLIMRFETPVSLPGIIINHSSKEDVKAALDEINRVYFSADFQIEIDGIYKQDDYYRIDYVRVLGGLPVYTYHYQPYLLVYPDGRIKEARFLLAEFSNADSPIRILAGEDLKEIINTSAYKKSVYFDFVDPGVHDLFDSEYGYDITGEEEGEILIEGVDLFYYYQGKFASSIVPTFFFKGSGFVEIEGEIYDADFSFSGDSASK